MEAAVHCIGNTELLILYLWLTLMKRTLFFIFGLLLIPFACVPAHSQSGATSKDYKLVSTDSATESGREVLIADYVFKGSTIKTREKYFKNRKEQNEGLAAATKNYAGCGPQVEIFDNTGILRGRKIVCEDKPSKTYTIAYSHYDVLNKVNVISGESERIVEEFVKGICPYAYHLYPEIECPGNDDRPLPEESHPNAARASRVACKSGA